MPFTAKVLADGQVANSEAAVYTVPADTVAYIKRITLFNTSADDQTILVYLRPDATSRLWRRYVLAQNESAELLEAGDSLILETGDTLRMSTTDASVVDYFVCGVEET